MHRCTLVLDGSTELEHHSHCGEGNFRSRCGIFPCSSWLTILLKVCSLWAYSHTEVDANRHLDGGLSGQCPVRIHRRDGSWCCYAFAVRKIQGDFQALLLQNLCHSFDLRRRTQVLRRGIGGTSRVGSLHRRLSQLPRRLGLQLWGETGRRHSTQ